MATEEYINKVVITSESRFDYEDSMKLGIIPKTDIINLIEDYIDIKQTNGTLLNCRYFRVKYFDEVNDVMLMLFLYKGQAFGSMQIWKLSGACKACDWNEDLEEDGEIRNWVKTKVEDLQYEEDWVERLRMWYKQQEEYQKEMED